MLLLVVHEIREKVDVIYMRVDVLVKRSKSKIMHAYVVEMDQIAQPLVDERYVMAVKVANVDLLLVMTFSRLRRGRFMDKVN